MKSWRYHHHEIMMLECRHNSIGVNILSSFLWISYHFLFQLTILSSSSSSASEYSPNSTPMYSMSMSPHPGVDSSRGGGVAPHATGTASSPTPAIPTPSSAAYTFSLDGYMEPKLSTGTPRIPSRSQLPMGTPSEESYPVFSPPPYPALQGATYTPRSSLVGPPHAINHRAYAHRPSISVSSPAPSHHTCNVMGVGKWFVDILSQKGNGVVRIISFQLFIPKTRLLKGTKLVNQML